MSKGLKGGSQIEEQGDNQSYPVDGDNEVEEGLHASSRARRVVQDLEDVISLMSSTRNLNAVSRSHFYLCDR